MCERGVVRKRLAHEKGGWDGGGWGMSSSGCCWNAWMRRGPHSTCDASHPTFTGGQLDAFKGVSFSGSGTDR